MIRTFLGFLVVAAFGCACAFGQLMGTVTVTQGTVTVTQDSAFPPVGLAPGQTAAVSLVNIAPASTTSGATAPSCTGTVTFTNASGSTIGTPTSFTTTGSAIQTVSLPFANSGLSTRGEILASVQQTITRPSAAPCSLVFSLEIFTNSSGATQVFLGNASAAAPPVMVISPEPVH
jgi:hypothetical protein